MNQLKPYVHLEETGKGDFLLHVLVDLPQDLKLGAIKNSVNSVSKTREITIPLEKQGQQAGYRYIV